MDKELLVYSNDELGFNKLFDIETCTVGIINGHIGLSKENQKKIERHNETDEIFIPIKGKSALFVGEDRKYVELYPGKVYCVKKGIWHSFVSDAGGTVIAVEKTDTGDGNSEYRFKW